jgi:hypothetical protein
LGTLFAARRFRKVKNINLPAGLPRIALIALMLALGIFAAAYGPSRETMLILRGVAGDNAPRGLLDDESAVAYARVQGYSAEVLDVASDLPAGKSQVQMALERIRADGQVTAIYGFSGGGYNAQTIWAQLSPEQRSRIRKIVVVGSPGVTPAAFPGSHEVIVQEDPPEGHMAGPKVLLQNASR